MLYSLSRLGGAACFACVMAMPAALADCPTPPQSATSERLMSLLEQDPELKTSLEQSIALGQRVNPDPNTNPVETIDDYLDFVDALVTYNPQNIDTGKTREGMRIAMPGDQYCEWNILDLVTYSYFLVDRQLTTDPRGQIQFMNPAFGDWMRGLAQDWGAYLETPASAAYVPDFEDDPAFGDWYCPAKPYASFQDFFTRELCADTFPNGSRPVEGLDDPRTVVSIGDSNSMGWWPIGPRGELVTGYDRISQSGRMIKGKLYNDVDTFVLGGENETVLTEFGEIDPSIFHGGIFTHQFLNVNNYHRLHLPVAGEIVYMRHIQAGSRMKASWRPPLEEGDVGFYDPRDTPDWQFGQTRLVLGIETEEYGTVVATPMGMAQVSAIELREWVEEGAEAQKGWEFANFAFGGSDFVILFEPQAEFRLTVPQADADEGGAGVNYEPSLQGEKYGCFGGVTDCDDTPGAPAPYPGMN